MNVLLLGLILSSGTYKCINGNEASICEQKVKVMEEAISVLYDGDCAGQGPYVYYCTDGKCDDGFDTVTFEIKDKTHYRWENKQYGFYCDFEKI